MAGFDEGNVFYSDSVAPSDADSVSHNIVNKSKFTQFLKTIKCKSFNSYKENLLHNYHNKQYYLEIQLDDIKIFDEVLVNEIIQKPDELIALMEDVVNQMLDEITKPRDEVKLPVIQVIFKWGATARSLRNIRSDEVSKLVKVSGIVISSSEPRIKASKLTLQCRTCRGYLPNIPVKPGFNSLTFPRKCNSASSNARAGAGPNNIPCPLDPYIIVTQMCQYVNYQTIKLQEAHEHVPHSEMPRHVQLYCERNLCGKAIPGSRVTIIGSYSVANSNPGTKSNSKQTGQDNRGVSTTYIRILGIQVEDENKGSSGGNSTSNIQISEEEEKEFLEFTSRDPRDVYEIIARSIAPNIFGFQDIKKALACLLLGGSRKRMPDGVYRRGDINVLLLGDPGTAKSQLLKFVSQCAPISVYTSGKGSSAAGLTASIVRDSKSRKFIMEGGAMVLADGGVVCIDEFDKMREDDRVAIHEAMEQQTISIAKAGITTMLNSRTAVLAAANSVYGRWDEDKGSENIDLMPTILSRFDMIFIVRDIHDETKDFRIASHTIAMQRNMEGNNANTLTQSVADKVNLMELTRDETSGVIPVEKLKKFIAFCRARCGPRMDEKAAEKLKNEYVQMRSGNSSFERESGKKTTIPITVRQCEAITRISESIAKMRLSPIATEQDILEALRLFQVSTLDAAVTGNLEGIEEFSSRENHEVLVKLEKSLKKRMPIGSQVSEINILQDLVNKGFPEKSVKRVLGVMIHRGEIQPRMQRKIFLRVK